MASSELTAEPAERRAPIMLSAGEASGDLHGGTLCRALRTLDPTVRLIGMGGRHMAAEGMEVLVDPTAEAAVGTSEALGRIPALYRAYRLLVERLRVERPRALVLIDFPEFNLRLAREARRAGVPVVYFIPPQIWAWRQGRVRQMARRVSRVLAVFPFEPPFYERHRVPVEFVGHPLLDVLPLELSRDEARQRLQVDPGHPMIGLLPGSRREELERLLPPMLDAARRLAVADGRRRFVLGLAPTISRGQVARYLEAGGGGPPIEVVAGRTYELMAAADVLLIASGTATLEAALLGAPMVLCYRVSRTTELIARLLSHVQWIGLPNLIAGRAVVPELVQGQVTGARLAAEAARLLDEDPVAAIAQRAAFKALRARLGEPGVGERAARAVLATARVG